MTRIFGMQRIQGGGTMVHIAEDSGGKLKPGITDRSLKEKHLTEVSMP